MMGSCREEEHHFIPLAQIAQTMPTTWSSSQMDGTMGALAGIFVCQDWEASLHGN